MESLSVLSIPVFFVAVGLICRSYCSEHYICDSSFAKMYANSEDVVKSETEAGHEGKGYSKQTILIPVPTCPYRSVLHAWLFQPKGNKVHPIIVMSHGFGLQKDMGLQAYAIDFVSKGFAVIVFDYRFFGGSFTSRPCYWRNLVYPWYHYRDVMTVVQFVAAGSLGVTIDAKNISLWGSSFSGGHVLMAASELPSGTLRCIISQVPHLSGKVAAAAGSSSIKTSAAIRLGLLAITDFFYSHLLGFPALYVKIFGGVEETAFIMAPEEELKTVDIFFGPDKNKVFLGGWRNLAPPRLLLFFSHYNPIEHVAKVQTPILFIGASKDIITPCYLVRDASKLAANCEYREYDCSHMEMYYGEVREQAIKVMTEFYAKHILNERIEDLSFVV
jgi:pimeloyl-ACP methyl ester carboxylesterase